MSSPYATESLQPLSHLTMMLPISSTPLTVPFVPIGGACTSSICTSSTLQPTGYSRRRRSTVSLLIPNIVNPSLQRVLVEDDVLRQLGVFVDGLYVPAAIVVADDFAFALQHQLRDAPAADPVLRALRVLLYPVVVDPVMDSDRAFLPVAARWPGFLDLDLEGQVAAVVHAEVLDRAGAVFVWDVPCAAGEDVRAAPGVQQRDLCVPADQVVEAFECDHCVHLLTCL